MLFRSLGFVLTLGAWFGGDRAVLRAAGARPLDPNAGAEELQLSNIVDELCLAANLPRPKVYTIDDTALNAFATGRNPSRAAVCVSTGLLDIVDWHELAGVLGHELAHVRNRDTLTMTVAATIAGAISMFANVLQFGYLLGQRRQSRSEEHTSELQSH